MFSAEFRVAGAWTSLDLPRAAADWRDRLGRVNVTNARLLWGPLDVSVRGGILTLDEDLRPSGGLQTRTRGFFDTVVALQEAGRMPEEMRADVDSLMRFLQLQSRRSSALGLPVRIENGEVWMGPAMLATVPALGPAAGD